MTTHSHPNPKNPRSRDRDTVDQMVFRWDTGNRSGNTGFGLVAWSCEDEQAEKVRGLARTLQVAGDEVAPGLVRMAVKARDETLLVHRRLGHDPGGRAGTVCHALLGPAEALEVETCLGLHHWSWEGSDLPLNETRGRLSPVPAAALLRSAMPQCDELAGRLPEAAGPLSSALAEVLRNPGSRHSFLDRRGGDLPHLVLWGLYGILRGMRAEHRLGWSFATHDTDDSQPFRFVFVPRWPASAAHDDRRVRADLERPTEDRALDLAAGLVRHHLEWSRLGGDGPSRVPSALAAAAEDAGGPEPGDALLVAAERAVEHLDTRVRRRRSAAVPPTREPRNPWRVQEQQTQPRRDERRHRTAAASGPLAAPERVTERPAEPRAAAGPVSGSGFGFGSGFGSGFGPGAQADGGRSGNGTDDSGSPRVGRHDDGPAALDPRSVRRLAAALQTSSDDELLRTLHCDLAEEETVLVLQEVRRRFERWPTGLRTDFGALALDMLLTSVSASASASTSADVRHPRSDQGIGMPPDPAPAPEFDSDDEPFADDRPHDRSQDRPQDPPQDRTHDRPRGGSQGGSHARPRGRTALARLRTRLRAPHHEPTADPDTRTHLPDGDVDSHRSPKSGEDTVSRWAVGVMVALIVVSILVIVLRIM